MFKKYFSLNNLSTLLLYFSILAFTVAFNFSDNRSGGWYQQFLPNLNGASISDITFVDSLVGYAVTNNEAVNDTDYILKTTNGGNIWNIIRTDIQTFAGFNKIVFLNKDTGYTCGVSDNPKFSSLQNTTNGGLIWENINAPDPFFSIDDISVLNNDTIWIAVSSNPTGGVFKTTNGGTSWTRQLNLGSLNPENIYMYNKDIGFISKVNTGAPYTRKTTDGGQSWFVVVNNEGFTDINFTDSLTGWKCYGELDSIKMTINGGLNWTKLLLPPTGGFFNLSAIRKFSFINKDTIWGVGARAGTSLGFRGLIYKSTNGGITWGYQMPDSLNINVGRYFFVDFVNKTNGWAYSTTTGVHTKIGGDTTFYTGVQQLVSVIPEDFELKQNYPNPFNPRTVIRFSLKKNTKVRLIVYDIRGIEVQRLADGRYDAGEYEADFMGKFSSSGVYFYRIEVSLSDPMEAEDERSGKIFSDTKRMILLK